MSGWYKRIKKFHELGLWDKNMVAEAVTYNKITPGEYEEITGEPYEGI